MTKNRIVVKYLSMEHHSFNECEKRSKIALSQNRYAKVCRMLQERGTSGRTKMAFITVKTSNFEGVIKCIYLKKP